MTKVTLSWINVALAGIKSHGSDTSSPIAVCTSDKGPSIKKRDIVKYLVMIIAIFNCMVNGILRPI